MTLAIEVVDTADQLAEIEQAWWDIWQRSPAATPFQCPGWLLPWWRVFHPGRLRAVAIWSGAELVALAPMYIEPDEQGDRVLPLGIGASDYNDLLAIPEFEREALAAISACVAGWRWREWEWCDLAPDSSAHRLPAPPESWDTRDVTTPCPVLALTRPETRAIPARKQRKWRMSRHRLDRRGSWRILETPALDAPGWCATLEALHAARWHARGQSGVLDGAMSTFTRAALAALIPKGLPRLYLLEIEGAPAGVHVGFAHGDRHYAWLGGFDPAAAYYSPGTVLLGHAIERATEEGATEFHFLRGAEPYKYEWGAADRWNARRSFRRVASS